MAEARAGGTYQVEPDFAARTTVTAAIMWLLAAVTLGLVVHALELFPGLSFDLPFLSWGRVRAAADTALVFGWLTTAGFAAAFALLPRLTEVQLHNEVLGAATTHFWSAALTFGIGTSLAGMNQGRPLAELPSGVDLALGVMLILVLFNAGVTAVRRRERTLFPAAWYLLAAVLLLPIVFAVGNLPVFSGVTDLIVSGFYQNGLELLWLLPVGLAVAHYVVPVETGNPVRSRSVAATGFWTLMFAGGWAGQRFAMKGPGPDYLEAIAFGMLLVTALPVVSSASNLFATARGRWALGAQAFGLRWAAAGLGLLVVWFGLVVVSAVPMVARFVGLTSWSAGLRHMAFYGVFTAFGFALIYHVYPLMVGRGWASPALASFHFWATLGGVAAGALLLMGSGIVAATTTAVAGAAGDPSALDATVRAGVEFQRGFRVLAAVAFGVVAVAQYVFAYNMFRTSRQGPLVQVLPAAQTTGSHA